MAVDLEAIRRKVQELSGQRRASNIQLWKPAPGEYKVRAMHSKNASDGSPFSELRFYYIGENPRVLAPTQFGKADPVNDLIRKLFSTRDPADRELAKKLQPKMTAYAPVIVRGEEAKGVQVWSFNRFVYQRLLSFFTDTELNPDMADFLDPLDGFDLKVTIKPSGKKFNEREVMDTTVDLGRKSCKLSNDPAQAKGWLDALPNISDMYQQKSAGEIEKMLTDWLAGGASDASSDGTSRGEQPKDALDKLVDDVRSAPAKAEAQKPKRGKKDVDIDADQPAVKKTSLDEAFDDLLNDTGSDS